MAPSPQQAHAPKDLEWIDRFVRTYRGRLRIHEEDRCLYVFPDFAVRANMTMLRILKILLGGQRVGALMRDIGDTEERRQAVEMPFIDLRTLLAEPMPKAPGRAGVTNMLYSRAHHTGPVSCEIALTYRCSRKCIGCGTLNTCSVGAKRYAEELSGRRWRDVFRKLATESQINGVTLTGGEPLLHKDFGKIIKYARIEKMAIHLVTSGGQLSDRLARRLGKYEVDLVTLKLVGSDLGIVDQWTRTDGVVERTTAALRLLRDHRIPTRAYAVLSRETASGFKDFIEWSARNHLSEILVELSIPAKREDMVPFEKLNQWIKFVAELCATNGIRLLWMPSMPICLVDPIHKGAYPRQGSVAEGGLSVAPDGSCLTWPTSGVSIGNILAQPISAIWGAPQARRLRMTDLYPQPCKRCSILGMCRAAAPWVRPVILPSQLRPNLKGNWRGEEDFAEEEVAL